MVNLTRKSSGEMQDTKLVLVSFRCRPEHRFSRPLEIKGIKTASFTIFAGIQRLDKNRNGIKVVSYMSGHPVPVLPPRTPNGAVLVYIHCWAVKQIHSFQPERKKKDPPQKKKRRKDENAWPKYSR